MKKRILAVVLACLMVFSFVACGESDKASTAGTDSESTDQASTDDQSAGAKKVIAVSLPSPSNQWVAAVIDYAQQEAAKDPDKFDVIVKTSDTPAAQASTIEDLMLQKPDVLAVFPIESAPLTPVCEKAFDQGIKTVILDRGIDSEKYTCYIAGDNYGIGREAAMYMGKRLNGKGDIVEIMGNPSEITTERSQGFHETIEKYFPGIKIIGQGVGNFARDPALKAMENLLQANSHIDAVYSHDDEQSLGIEVAVQNAGRTDVQFTTGAGGNKSVYEGMKEGRAFLGCTVTYPPTMGGTAVAIAKKIAMGQGLSESYEPEVPRYIKINASVVTEDNVEKFYNADSKY